MAHRRLFWFAYDANPPREDRHGHPLQMRDGTAALCLSHALAERGYQFESPICNYPSPGPDLVPFDDGFLCQDDLILLTTRPPIHDRYIGDRRSIRRSFTTLEERLFRGPLRVHFDRCARSEIMLTDATASISREIAARQSMEFYQNAGAGYQAYGSPLAGLGRRSFPRGETLTAAFLVYREHAWPGGPAFLAAFSMGGTETLGWAHMLHTRFADLLLTTAFAMVELQPTGATQPATLAFFDSWKATLLGTADLDTV